MLVLKIFILAMMLIVIELSFSWKKKKIFDQIYENLETTNSHSYYLRRVTFIVSMVVIKIIVPILLVAALLNYDIFKLVKDQIFYQSIYAYYERIHSSTFAAFAGMYLFNNALNYFFNENKYSYWFDWLESKLYKSNSSSIKAILISLGLLILLTMYIPDYYAKPILISGILGIFISSLSGGLVNFLYKSYKDNYNIINKNFLNSMLYIFIFDLILSFPVIVAALCLTKNILIVSFCLIVGTILTYFNLSKFILPPLHDELDYPNYLDQGVNYSILTISIIMLLNIIVQNPSDFWLIIFFIFNIFAVLIVILSILYKKL